jgi:HPt (histidine-containing phosphotransfer) domain-containing protein
MGKLPRALPGLDIQAGIRQLEGNKSLYIRLLKKFAECNLDLACKIEKSLDGNDHNAARILVHSTKGVSGSIGATDLYLAATTLESAVMRGDYTNALRDFSLALWTVLQSITALLYDLENIDIPLSLGGKSDIDTLTSMLEKLDHYLREGDFKALRSYAELRKYLAGSALEDEINSLESHIHHFDYKKVAEKLAMIHIKLRNRQL